MSDRSSSTKVSTGWRGNFFHESAECQPRIYDWMQFDIKNVARNSNNEFDSLNIDPDWMTSECNEEPNSSRGCSRQELLWTKPTSNVRSCVTRSSSKLSYDSTGPNDERYYVKPSSNSSISSGGSNMNFQRRKVVSKNQPMSLPVNLGQRLSSKSSPSLSVTKEEDEDEDEDDNFKGSGQPQPDYSPEREPKLDNSQRQKKVNMNVWANSNRYKGSLENVLDGPKSNSNVKKIANRIQNLSEQDINRRKERESIELYQTQDDDNCSEIPQVRFTGFDQLCRHSRAKHRPGISDPQVYCPPLNHQPLCKIPNEYEDFRKLSSRNFRSDFNYVQNPESKSNNVLSKSKKLLPSKRNNMTMEKNQNSFCTSAIDVLRHPQQSIIKAIGNQRSRNLSTSDGNSRMSSARSSVESWPLAIENDPEDTYSVILEDQRPPLPPLPPPTPFASLPVTTNFFGIRNDNYFRRRHGSELGFGEGRQRELSVNPDEGSSLFEATSLLRSTPPPISPPGFDEVQAKQSHFFNSLFPSRANRFGFPVYPERQFGIPSKGGPPVSFAGFSPDLRPSGFDSAHFTDDGSLALFEENQNRKRKKKSLLNFLKEWIDS